MPAAKLQLCGSSRLKLSMAKGKNKANATGRSNTSRFARLDHSLLESPAYRALSPNARALMVEFTRMDNSFNNGALWLSVRDAAALMGVSNTKSSSAALSELQGMGFIAMTKDAHFSIKAAEMSRARCWRLTWLPIPKRQGPTHDYQERQPTTKRARNRMEAGLRALKAFKRTASQNQMPVDESHTLTPFQARTKALAVGELHTAKPVYDAFPPKLTVGDLQTHTADQRGRERKASLSLVWWQPNGLAPLIASMAALEAAASSSRQSENERLAA
jgi:hypothetical protein